MRNIKAIIAQTDRGVLDLLKNYSGLYSNIDAEYVSRPKEALELIGRDNFDVLVSGQIFHQGNIEFELDIFRGGNILSKKAREINPELITIRYSGIQNSIDGFCGDIVKGAYVNPLQVLTNKFFLDALRNKDKSSLPINSSVSWYYDNFPESWE